MLLLEYLGHLQVRSAAISEQGHQTWRQRRSEHDLECSGHLYIHLGCHHFGWKVSCATLPLGRIYGKRNYFIAFTNTGQTIWNRLFYFQPFPANIADYVAIVWLVILSFLGQWQHELCLIDNGGKEPLCRHCFAYPFELVGFCIITSYLIVVQNCVNFLVVAFIIALFEFVKGNNRFCFE